MTPARPQGSKTSASLEGASETVSLKKCGGARSRLKDLHGSPTHVQDGAEEAKIDRYPSCRA